MRSEMTDKNEGRVFRIYGPRKEHNEMWIDSDIDDLEFLEYRKKPVVIDAVQVPVPFKVKTLEGTMEGKAGDWLIKGVEGEFYPCDDSIFKKTYNPEPAVPENGGEDK